MSPEAKFREFFYQEKDESPKIVQPVISIGLNEPGVFNAAEFDKLVKDSMKPNYAIYSLKYIAVDDTLYIFPSTLRHNKAYKMLKDNGIAERLQSAGYVGVHFEDDGSTSRFLDQYASTLVGLLSEESSNYFKNTVIKEKLGEYFQVS